MRILTELPRSAHSGPNGFQGEVFAFCPFPFDFPSILIPHKQLRINAGAIEIGAPEEVGAGNISFADNIPLLDTYRVQGIRDVHNYFNLFALKTNEDNSKLRMICLSITSIIICQRYEFKSGVTCR